MSPGLRVYTLSTREFSPEIIAVAFAKTSRSPQSFDVIARDLNEDQSRRFHEKWVIGYGHASVAEHAVLHLAIEGASRLAIESLQSARLASYTEQSTRYQKWNPEAFHRPAELQGHPLHSLYEATVRRLFQTYRAIQEPVQRVMGRYHPRREGETPEAWERRIRTRYMDVCRFLLPAATLANVGMTVNARVLAHTLRKMLAHPLAEVRELATRMKQVALQEAPTLVRYVEPDRARAQALENLRHHLRRYTNAPPQPATDGHPDWLRLVHYDADGEIRVLAAALYRVSHEPYPVWLERVRNMSAQERTALVRDLLSHLGPHDVPLRELEHTTYTVEVVLDQGAYYELKRHRMMTLTPQALTARLGYTVPQAIVEAGVEAPYREAMEQAGETYQRLAAWNPQVAAYVVPNGFRRRALFTFNARQAYHLCQLRAAGNAHFSMRRFALRLAEVLQRVHPALFAFLHLPATTWQEVERRHFAEP